MRTAHFTHQGQRLAYDERGDGERVIVLVPGLLLPRSMHHPLADALAARGNRVVCFDPLGQGGSDRPVEMWRYSMQEFGAQVVALLDALEVERAVVGGTSLGANVSLEVAVRAPERLHGIIVEMPVLDNALLGCALAFTPMLVALTLGRRATRVVSRVAAHVPRGMSQLGDVGLDWVSQDPEPSAAYLQGLFFGRIAPTRAERRAIDVPALVIGHPRDPIHPFSDSDTLARELPRGRLVRASSILELRLKPRRLIAEIADFVEGLFWRPARRERRRAAS